MLALAGYPRAAASTCRGPATSGRSWCVWVVSLLVLIYQRDLGTSLLFFGMFVMMLYVSTERAGWAILGTLLFAAGAWFAFVMFDHVKIRVWAWLDPFSDFDRYYQVIVAQFGLAWGGLLGTGLGLGRPGLTPLARSDFIAAAIGEELGDDRPDRGHPDLRPDRGPRSARRAAVPGVRSASCSPPASSFALRPAGVHHHRRRHPAAAADRSDHAVHVPGRLVAGLQLGRRRPC